MVYKGFFCRVILEGCEVYVVRDQKSCMPECSGPLYRSHQLPEYMQNLKDQLQEELKSTTTDRRAMLEAELLRLQEERRRALVEKDKERDGRLRRELDRLASSSYSGSLSLKQRFVCLCLKENDQFGCLPLWFACS